MQRYSLNTDAQFKIENIIYFVIRSLKKKYSFAALKRLELIAIF